MASDFPLVPGSGSLSLSHFGRDTVDQGGNLVRHFLRRYVPHAAEDRCVHALEALRVTHGGLPGDQSIQFPEPYHDRSIPTRK